MIGSSIIVSAGQDSGKIQQFEWDGSSISEGRIVDDVGDYRQMTNPIVIPELFEECERPTNEFIFGAPLGETMSHFEFTAFDFSLATLDFSETTPYYFKGVINEMDPIAYSPGYVNYKGQIYMMGGTGLLWKKIFKFTGSTTEEVALSGDLFKGYARLYGNNPVVGWQDNQERIFLCFNSYDSVNSCQTFDGSVIRNVADTVYEHYAGSIGTFERNKEVVAIGGRNAAGKVEIFDGTSWRNGPDQPNNYRIGGVSVDVGAGIITIGGEGNLVGYSAYLLTYDNMIENTKKWVDLGRLQRYYNGFSAFRFGEIIIAHTSTGIYMLTWDGNNLRDQGLQIDLGLYSGGTGIFIPKEDTKCESIFIGETPQRDTDVDEVLIFEQKCDIRNNDAYIIKFEVECDFDKITGKNTMFMGTENDNQPFKLDTYKILSGGVTTSVYHLYFPPTGFEIADFFTDDFRADGFLYFHNDICTKGEYMEFVMKQWTDDEGFWRKTLEIDGVLKARYSRGDFTAYLSFSELINGRLGHHATLSNDSPQFTRNGLGVKNYSIREY